MAQAAARHHEVQYVTLGIGREVFAVEVAVVQEILEMRQISLLPHAPAFMLGVIDVRGRAVPVIDLRVKLGLPPVAATEHTRILVMEVPIDGKPLAMGLVADRVFEVTGLNADGVESPPEIGVRWRSEYIRGIARHADNFVIIFDLAQLFSSEEAALLTDGG